MVRARHHGSRPTSLLPWRYPLASTPHEAFALAFRPSERLFHRFALVVTQAHLGQGCLGIDLLGDLRRSRGCRDRQDLMLVGVRVVIEGALRRTFFLPNLQ